MMTDADSRMKVGASAASDDSITDGEDSLVKQDET
jgi:hypothetical protein